MFNLNFYYRIYFITGWCYRAQLQLFSKPRDVYWTNNASQLRFRDWRFTHKMFPQMQTI